MKNIIAALEAAEEREKSKDFPYYYAWKNNPKRRTLYHRRCRILARFSMNSALVEFENGQKEVISRNALRRVK